MVKLILWAVVSMITLDLGVNYLFASPENGVQPSKLTRYFDYGRSTESKLLRIVAANNDEAADIAKAGWFEAMPNGVAAKKKPQLFVYGMSFSNHIGGIIAHETDDFDVRLFAGPGAPLNHSYAYYLRHRTQHKKGDVVVLGILASAIPKLNTMGGMTASFEGPTTHMYPRYSLDVNDKLIEKQLPIFSLNEFREVLHNQTQWSQVKRRLSDDDSFYDEVTFSAGFIDKSTYLSVFRRAWAAKHKQNVTNQYFDDKGFKNTHRMVEVAQKIVSEFAYKAREDGVIPFIVLFNNRGYGDHLFSMLNPVLTELKIPYYSTHKDFSATQLSNFLPDGHFKPKVDRLIALDVLGLLEKLDGV